MTGALEKLNLRPQERRFLVIAGLIVFVVVNIWFIWPHFNDWQMIQNKTALVAKNLKAYQAEVANVPGYQSKLAKLKTTGSDILSEELQLQRIVQAEAASSGVLVTRYDPRAKGGGGRTNQFFEDQLLSIDCTTGPKELVNFLVGLAAGNSMIRVREMNLRPDGSQTKLLATITFVASYQKKAPSKPAPVIPTSSTGVKPAATNSRPAVTTAKQKDKPVVPAAKMPGTATNKASVTRPKTNSLPAAPKK